MSENSKTVIGYIIDAVAAKPDVNLAGIIQAVKSAMAVKGEKAVGRDFIIGLVKQLVETGRLADNQGERKSTRTELKYRKVW